MLPATAGDAEGLLEDMYMLGGLCAPLGGTGPVGHLENLQGAGETFGETFPRPLQTSPTPF